MARTPCSRAMPSRSSIGKSTTKLAPNGRLVRDPVAPNISRNWSGLRQVQARWPRPPASETAAANSTDAMAPIGAWNTGARRPRRLKGCDTGIVISFLLSGFSGPVCAVGTTVQLVRVRQAGTAIDRDRLEAAAQSALCRPSLQTLGPAVCPGCDRFKGAIQADAKSREAIAVDGKLDELGVAQLPEAAVEKRRRDIAAGLLQRPKLQRAVSQLPDGAKKLSPRCEIQQRHDGPSGFGSPDALAGQRRCRLLHSLLRRPFRHPSVRATPTIAPGSGGPLPPAANRARWRHRIRCDRSRTASVSPGSEPRRNAVSADRIPLRRGLP